ncbi:hypothetical protein [Desulfovibrio aminophilus]|uniref:hypothetical protein n=1 Tax=Desulfovibrio aminophilus TaxID=81425 RepID=UPI0033933844
MIERPRDYGSFVALARNLRVDTRGLEDGLEQRVLTRIRREGVVERADRFLLTLAMAYGGATAVAMSCTFLLERAVGQWAWGGLLSAMGNGLFLAYGG